MNQCYVEVLQLLIYSWMAKPLIQRLAFMNIILPGAILMSDSCYSKNTLIFNYMKVNVTDPLNYFLIILFVIALFIFN